MMTVRRLGYALGARVTGIDLTRALPEDAVAEIRQAWLEHGVLCFPEQRLEPSQLAAFCARFGEVDDSRRAPRNRHPDAPAVMVISNKPVVANGKTVGEPVIADLWHSDPLTLGRRR